MKKNFLLIPLVFLTLYMIQCSPKTQHNDNYLSDGLSRSTPEAEGVESEGILKFVEGIEKNNLEVHSFMLLRHGKVIAEGSWSPYQSDIRHIMYSASKAYITTAIGFAVSENLISIDDKVVSFFPEYETQYSDNQYMKDLTIKNLLTMSAGEEPYTDFTLRDHDWIKIFFGAKLNSENANKFFYNTYGPYMMSVILQRVTGETMLDYLKPRLFDPLGTTDITSEQSPAGIECAGWGMSVKTSDMAKLGQLYLQKGEWNGKQLLPISWIEEASKKQIETSADSSSSSDWAQGYGYLMWRCRYNSYRADGAFGQFIIIMPEQDAVLAITANVNDGQNELQQVWKHILPAISDKKLPDNKEAYEALTKKLESLTLSKMINNDTKIENNNFSKTYTMENNELNIKSIAIKQRGDSCKLIIRTNTATHNFICGYNNWKYNKTDKNSPYYNAPYRNSINMSPYIVAGSYTWKDAQNMLLNLLYLEDSSSETYEIAFEDKKIIISITNNDNHHMSTNQLVGYLN